MVVFKLLTVKNKKSGSLSAEKLKPDNKTQCFGLVIGMSKLKKSQ